MLFLVATPIGNLADLSFRAIECLNNADIILCEDTRHSLKLLSHYQIKKPLWSYHKFNEKEKISELLPLLKEGKKICLISDAGTPLIADPGNLLVQKCIEENIQVLAIPGPCALIQALICSGLSYERFQFIGFLPKKEKELIKTLNELIEYPGVSICYESPERIKNTLEILSKISPNIPICIAKELTKKFESFLRGTATSLFQKLADSTLKGEHVLIIKGSLREVDFSSLSVEEHVLEIQKNYQVTKKEAIKIVANQRQLNKRDLYKTIHTPAID